MALRKKQTVKVIETPVKPVEVKPVEPEPTKVEAPVDVQEVRKLRIRALGVDRREPYTGQHFPAGQAVEVEAITSWLQCQIDARIMEIV